eukprot:scaffold48787_cov89-Cyclotella_meneghiniana.AAC.4
MKCWLNKKSRGWDISHVIEANDAQPFKMMGDKYIQLYATVTQAQLNKDIQYGHCTMADFKRHYGGIQGLTVEFDTPDGHDFTYKLPISWSSLVDVDDADDFLLFGKPLDRSRNYKKLFKNKKSRDTI